MAKRNVYLESKPRYEILDGLRGVAALMVIVFHCFETYIPVFNTQIVNHGYLAVDFFFVLSGFVIGYAYDDRWGSTTVWGFFKRRLTRLHPMVIAGTLIGASLFFFSGAAFPMTQTVPGWKFTLCLVMGLLMLPCGESLDIRGWNETNSFNGPSWSLMFEYIGNILYAFVLRHLPNVVLGVICVCCAFFTLDLTLGWDVFGFFPDGPQYTVIGGWSLSSQQLYVGFTRLLYPFICGLLISRIVAGRRTSANPSGSPLHLRGGFWLCSLVLVAIFSIPCIGGTRGVADGIYQAACILALFPLIVLAGAGSVTTDAHSTKVCKWLGDISFPIYITHYPIMYMQMGWVAEHADAPLWMHIAVNLGVLFMAIVIAWGVMKVYDEPVRRWLKVHWLGAKPR
ncbi:MAG: acyltransferase family protein [Muribaculaceae bacterium]